jgi:hypothetical protein
VGAVLLLRHAGLLIFYLTQHFLFNDATASETYGSYTSLVYLLPLLGGILADRWHRHPQGHRLRRPAAGRRPRPDGL